MRFWTKTKLGDKKASREKLASAGELPEGDVADSGSVGDGELQSVCE